MLFQCSAMITMLKRTHKYCFVYDDDICSVWLSTSSWSNLSVHGPKTEATLKSKKRKTVAERTILNIITQHLFKDIIITNDVPDPTWILLIKSYDYEFQKLYRVTIICISLVWFGLTWVPAREWVGVWTKKRSGHCSGHIVDFRLSLKKKRQSVAYNSIFSSLFQSHYVQSHISKGKDFNLSVTTIELNGKPFILVHSFFCHGFWWSPL